MPYWLSTRSHPEMFKASYRTPERDQIISESAGVDPAILAIDIGIPVHHVRAYQRALGVRALSNPRKVKIT